MLTLGIDSSTQSVKAVVYDADGGRIVASASVNYGRDLPEFGSPNGFLPHADVRVRRAAPAMWIAGIARVLHRLRASGAPMADIRAVGGGAQQHATVYLNAEGVKGLSDGTCFDTPLEDWWSRPLSPIWMDSSTECDVETLNRRFGDELVRTTGSVATARFAAAQIMKFAREEPAAWRATARVHLLSSFLTSVFAGEDAPVERGDGMGMNLMDAVSGEWHRGICEFVSSDLLGKLPRAPGMVAPENLRLSAAFARFGLTPGIPVAPFTGDNPASLVGCGAVSSGDAVISLGTSDTMMMAMDAPRFDPDGCGHVFGNPMGGYMALTCFTNGSLARDRVRRECGVDWHFFDEVAFEGEAPVQRPRAFPYFEAETTPRHAATGVEADFEWDRADSTTKIRAIVEGQVCNMRDHTRWMGAARRILLTGGASRSRGLRETIQRVFGVGVEVLDSTDSVAIGGALLARMCAG